MNLPFFRKNHPRDRQNFFYALEISHEVVKSAIWGVYNGRSQALSVGSNALWDDKLSESFLQACDQSLSDASVRLDPSGKIQPEKLILGLPPDWIIDGRIETSRQQLIKNLTQKFSLTAIGYVLIPDALVRFLHHQEGVSPTAILLGFRKSILELTLVRLGRIDATHIVKRSPNTVDDVIEGLSRFSHVDMFPSRMLLYDSGLDLEEVKQQLLSHPWQSPQTRLPFLHFPKIETLPTDFTIRALALAGGTEVALSLGLISQETPASSSVISQTAEKPTASPEELGFFPQEVPPSISTANSSASLTTSSLPVVKQRFSLPRLPSLKFKPPTFSGLSFPKLKFSASPILAIVIFIATLLGLFVAYWYLPQATVVLSVASRSLSHNLSIVADSQSATVDSSNLRLPARFLEVSISPQASTPTTGTQLVGDKASGSVTIINGTSSPRSLPVGTVITSASGLKFSLSEAVQVASASGTADPNSYQPGKAEVKVVSSQIGSDNNLSAGSQFRIGTFSTLDMVAKNDIAFSGGSSRQAKSVSTADISGLRTEAQAQARDKAESDLRSQASSQETLILESLQINTLSEDFDYKVNDIADNVTLNLKAKATAIVFSTADFQSLVDSQIQSLIPDGYTLSSSTDYRFSVQKIEKSSVKLSVDISAALTPVFDLPKLSKDIAGKRPQQAQQYLSNLPNVVSTSFTFSLPLPSSLLTFPHPAKNIHISVTQQ